MANPSDPIGNGDQGELYRSMRMQDPNSAVGSGELGIPQGFDPATIQALYNFMRMQDPSSAARLGGMDKGIMGTPTLPIIQTPWGPQSPKPVPMPQIQPDYRFGKPM